MNEDWPPSREWLDTALEGGEITQEQYDHWTGPRAHFESERHALYAGWVLGCAMRAGVKVTPGADEHGNYTDRFTVELPDRRDPVVYTITLVVPPPPDDWEFPR